MILSEVEIIGLHKGACPSGGADVLVPSPKVLPTPLWTPAYLVRVPGRMAGALFHSNGLVTVYH